MYYYLGVSHSSPWSFSLLHRQKISDKEEKKKVDAKDKNKDAEKETAKEKKESAVTEGDSEGSVKVKGRYL